MSANLDIVRAAYSAWAHGDYKDTRWADPAVEFEIVGGPDTSRWTGVAGMEKGWREWLAEWKDFRADAVEFDQLHADCVLVYGRLRGLGRTSGALVEGEFANVFDFRDGRVVRLRLYADVARARADLGLVPDVEAHS